MPTYEECDSYLTEGGKGQMKMQGQLCLRQDFVHQGKQLRA